MYYALVSFPKVPILSEVFCNRSILFQSTAKSISCLKLQLGGHLEQSKRRATATAVARFQTSNLIQSPQILFGISINLLVFYHECRSLIGYATHYLFCDR